MANAKKCDRCGRFYDGIIMDTELDAYGNYIEHITVLRTNRFNGRMGEDKYDLCSDCCRAFVEWLKGGESSNETHA